MLLICYRVSLFSVIRHLDFLCFHVSWEINLKNKLLFSGSQESIPGLSTLTQFLYFCTSNGRRDKIKTQRNRNEIPDLKLDKEQQQIEAREQEKSRNEKFVDFRVTNKILRNKNIARARDDNVLSSHSFCLLLHLFIVLRGSCPTT